MIRIFFIIIFILNTSLSVAQSTYTLKSSCTTSNPCNWDNSNSWVGGIVPENNNPASGSIITIPENTQMNVRGGGNKVTINNQVTIQVYGIMQIGGGGGGPRLDLENGNSSIQVDASGDIVTNGPGGSEQIEIGTGKIQGSAIDNLQSPNQITQETLNDANNPGGCAESNTCNEDPLPVELLFFKGHSEINQNKVLLSWATATEENFDYFELSHSLDGEYFEVIGRIDGHGTTTLRHDYQYVDQSPYNGLNYYQLKSVDYDGSIEVFDLVAVQLNNDLNPSIYPNPLNGTHLTVAGLDANNAYNIQVLSLNGHVYYESVNQKSNKIILPGNLPGGVYIVSITVGNQFFREKLIVQ